MESHRTYFAQEVCEIYFFVFSTNRNERSHEKNCKGIYKKKTEIYLRSDHYTCSIRFAEAFEFVDLPDRNRSCPIVE